MHMAPKQADRTKTNKTRESTTDVAAATLGISASQFRRIVTVRGYEPSRIEEWHYGRSSGTKHFWSRRTIATIRRTKDYAQAVERAVNQRRKLDDLRAEQERRRQAEKAVLGDVEQLPLDQHIRLALECLHAANRAAKHPNHAYSRPMIYGVKDAFLSAMIRVQGATVGTFEIQQNGRHQTCADCGHEWVGDGYCYSCDDDSGVSSREVRRWYLVDCGSGYRFHKPNLDADLAKRAVPIEPHDPTQEPRTIPSVRFRGECALDLGTQVKIVLSAANRLGGGSVACRIDGDLRDTAV
jgi:hypothetical protein